MSGVVLFDRGALLVEKWLEACKIQASRFRGDQEVLSRMLFDSEAEIDLLPETYNWPGCCGIHFDALIVHWCGPGGKAVIRTLGGIGEHLNKVFES